MRNAAIALVVGTLLFGCVQQGAPPETGFAPEVHASVEPAYPDALDETGGLEGFDEEMTGLEEELDDWLEGEGFNVSNEELELLG